MKKFFSSVWRKWKQFYEDNAFFSGLIIVLLIFLTSSMLIYFGVYKYLLSSEAVNEEKYKQYEMIVQQILDRGLLKVTLPENTRLDIDYEKKKIYVVNVKTHYSVIGDFNNSKMGLTRKDGKNVHIMNSLLGGALVICVFFLVLVLWFELSERKKYHLTL